MSVVGVGVDIEPIASFRDKPLERHKRFYARLFSAAEIDECARRKDPYPGLAARFCAKEAMVKACSGHAKAYVTDFSVVKDGPAPAIALRRPRPALRRFLARHSCKLSLSHTDDLAAAFVVVSAKAGAA